MGWQSWWLFVGAVFLLSGTPGPNMLHVMRQSIAVGFVRATATMAGCLLAIVLVLSASAAGLSALLIAWPRLFDAIRYAGVAYLFYLGVKAWRSSGASPAALDPLSPAVGRWSLFRGGLLIGLTNPKLILFAAAFLPQFIDPVRPQVPQFAILVATFAVIESGWYAAYGLGGRQLARYLATPARQRLFDRLTGTLFIGFGTALLAARA
ncbi:LysE family translocator [Sphingomonas sp. KR1UV-12]|uniref:LysE family translocator n=1 Tax=Sphingomonas aurea TaxID=3063994 RepID=A0ABT9EGN1_9SPHN|nr:LysE family translocator [Sphingomonas sp. KR1UV-12]MDP1026126.1 LysE family translocator [Sphingomonas sp. KR1UV-12]